MLFRSQENLTAFTNGLPVTWKLSLAQLLADALTLLSLVGALGLLLWCAFRRLRRLDVGVFEQWWQHRGHLTVPLTRLLAKARTALLAESPRPVDGFRRFLTFSLLVIGLGFVVYICAFKLLDRDFWWHITAGKIMVDTGRLISTEPFAYTREGLPYLANHEWLAQIVLYLLYATGGSVAIVLFRTAAMAITVSLLFFIDTKRAWLSVPLGVLVANAIRPAFIERPQLLTFMFFSVGLLLMFRTLEILNSRPLVKREWLRLSVFFLLLQIAWVNTHGAAGLLAFLFPAVLFLDQLYLWFRAAPSSRARYETTMRWLVLLSGVTLVGLFLSPITYHNITYVWNLFSDRTMQYIGEWRPREWGEYLPLIGPFWLIGAAAIAAGRRNVLACVFLVLITGYVGKGAMRHEPLFVLSVMAIAIHQMRFYGPWNALEQWLLKRRIFSVLLALAIVFALFQYVHAKYTAFTVPDRLQGYGQFDFGKSAVDFLEKEDIQGRMFNTYGFGGYLIHRGYPDRKVFFDGRNVDHGFALMNLAYLAGQEAEQWKKMQHRYDFTYAVVDYPANTDQEKKTIQYAEHLDTNAEWPLVYLDDWVAIYLKDVPENRAVIDRYAYKILRTTKLEFETLRLTTPVDQLPLLEKELKQAIDSDPRSVKARLALGKLLIADKRFDEAYVYIQDAMIVWPEKPEPHALMGALFVGREQWAEAADAFHDAITLAGPNYPDIDYATVAQVFAKAGRMREAEFYARKAGKVLTPRQENVETDAGEAEQAPMVNPAQDAIDFENQALELAAAGKLTEAREQFQNALKLNPGYPEGWNNLGTLSFHEGKLDEAKTKYLRALEEWPEYPDAHYNLALLYHRLGDLKAAKTYAKKARELGMDTTSLEKLLE